jgi:hypothetical protein
MAKWPIGTKIRDESAGTTEWRATICDETLVKRIPKGTTPASLVFSQISWDFPSPALFIEDEERD